MAKKQNKKRSISKCVWMGGFLVVFAVVATLLLTRPGAAPGDPLTNDNLDLNSDGTVSIFDLSQLLSQWNSSGSADFNGDNVVSIFDLSLLLAQWGHVDDTGPPTGNTFADNFNDPEWEDRYDFAVFHRDDSVIRDTVWQGDHASIGPNDACSAPTVTRTVTRGDRHPNFSSDGIYRDDDFNNEWIYRCEPGADVAKAHLMTSIGDTSGYSIGSFAPKQTFNGITEVRWDVNQTDLGDRQWTEVAIIPAAEYDAQNLPCQVGLPCGRHTHETAGSVGTQWAGQRARLMMTPSEPEGYTEAGGALGYRCDGCPYAPSVQYGRDFGAGDPALTSVAIRRENYFRDNQNGTLTWGFELYDQPGEFREFTTPGSFPSGDVRVVFKDHNYTPMKSPATLNPTTTFTWHWDDIMIQ